MMMSTPSDTPKRCKELALVDAHFAGTIQPADERTLRDHLGGEACALCHARYRRQLLLAKLAPTAEGPSREERIGRGLGVISAPAAKENKDKDKDKDKDKTTTTTTARPFFARPQTIALAASLAMAAVLFLVIRRPRDQQFTPRGAIHHPSAQTVPSNSNSNSSSRISVFRIATKSEGSVALLAGAAPSIARGDELAFQYTNAARKTHLMIFGVDENRRVYWFYPAWTNENENPTAVPIATDTSEPHELREAIRHPFEGHRVTIHGLFLDRPMTVKEVETTVRASETAEIMVSGAIDDVIMLEVLQ
jgi:hypothetical protein